MSRLKGYKHSDITKLKIGVKNTGEDNGNWKNGSAKYRAIHIWVERKLGKPRFCENCGSRNLKHRQYHWSNISGKYKRVLNDWKRLCIKCHFKFDRNEGRWKNGRPPIINIK